VVQDEEEAVKLFSQAAEQGLAAARFALGSCYAAGRGCVINGEEAVKLYRQAAEQGNAAAQHALSNCYAR